MVVALGVFIALYAVYRVVERRRKLPSVTLSAWEALMGVAQGNILDRHLAKAREAWAKGEKCYVISFWHAPRVIATADPLNVEHMLVTNFQNYDKGPVLRGIFRDLLGQGIFNADGATWKEHRKTASHEFSARSLRDFMAVVFRRRSKELCAKLRGRVDAQDAFSRYTLHSIGEIGFGVDLSGSEVGRAFDLAVERMPRRFVDPLWQLSRLFDLGAERQMREAIRELDRFSEAVIQDRRQSPLGNDILSLYMKRDPNASTRYLRDVVVNFILAGRDTTSNLLTWTLYEIADRPDVIDRLRAEIHRDVKSYSKAVLTETLRLHPSVHTDFKEANGNDVFPDGTFVAKGERVMYTSYSMARNPQVWGADCEQFKPERFLHPTTHAFVAPKAHVFPAFHAGPRLCLGKDVAYLSATTALLAVLDAYDFHLIQPKSQIRYHATLTLWVKDGLPVVFTPRTSS